MTVLIIISTNSGSKHMLVGNLLLVLVILSASVQNAFATTNVDPIMDKLRKIDANVLLMRHAIAPGFGDPANFVINQCNTQRNLDAVGRSQAISLGQKLKQSAIVIDKIYSSYWCRCLETAKLLQLGEVERFAGLNSFFEGHADRNETLKLLQEKLAALSQNSLTLMVTHQVVIQAVSGIGVSSGEIVAYNTRTRKAVRVAIE
ncbi:histidine phosphatase family protein [Colwellia sp. MB3u-4]|uniref:histidine phosphatase family protein n=1 Tax=Colwellia sp. MB3u-4 TaxID=2759822 RepID=UPI00287005DD|nr:histidine phosphatase family protein [Colwellia sp. MB3u-4]